MQIVVNMLGAVSAMGHVLRTEVLQSVERLVAARLPGAAAGPAGVPRNVVESFGCLELVELCIVSGPGPWVNGRKRLDGSGCLRWGCLGGGGRATCGGVCCVCGRPGGVGILVCLQFRGQDHKRIPIALGSSS